MIDKSFHKKGILEMHKVIYISQGLSIYKISYVSCTEIRYGIPGCKGFYFQWKSFRKGRSTLDSLKDKEYGTRKQNTKSHCIMCAYITAHSLYPAATRRHDMFVLCSVY